MQQKGALGELSITAIPTLHAGSAGAIRRSFSHDRFLTACPFLTVPAPVVHRDGAVAERRR